MKNVKLIGTENKTMVFLRQWGEDTRKMFVMEQKISVKLEK
jgi:hypothetical protein